MKSFQQTQLELARYLRSPEQAPAPAQVETRRLHIYRDLIYNNIENFIATVFPITRSLLTDDDWYRLVRGFIQSHYCQTPYFLQISDEFVQYVLHERGLQADDPPYLLELIHYEWIELALDVSTQTIPPPSALPAKMERSRPRVSPLAICLSYQYPVQKISKAYPNWQPDATYLVVYRDRADKVCFMAANPLTVSLLSLLQERDCPLMDHLTEMATNLGQGSAESFKNQAISLLENLYSRGVISHFE